MKLKILWMYHDLMDLYGDKGNIEVLRRRAEKRGIECVVDTCTLDEKKEIQDDHIPLHIEGVGDGEFDGYNFRLMTKTVATLYP